MTASHVRHPAPINQFYHLEQDGPGLPWRKTTPWNDVIAGHDFDAEDCMAAEGVVILDAHTSGRIHSTAHAIRLASGDLKGGIGVDDVQTAAEKLYGQSILTPRDFSRSDAVHAVRGERRHVGFGVQYNVLPDSIQYQLPGNFAHAMGLDDIRDSDGYGLIYDSLGTGPVWRPLSGIWAAAEKLATMNGRSAGQLFAMVSASRPALATGRFEATLPADAFFTYDVTGYVKGSGGGRVVDRDPHTRGHTDVVPVSAPPANSTRWTGHPSRRLVQIMKGVFAGSCIAASYAQPV